jgi:hypothetical protein
VKAHPSLYHKRAFSIVALSKFKEVATHSAFRQRLALFLILFSVSERTNFVFDIDWVFSENWLAEIDWLMTHHSHR